MEYKVYNAENIHKVKRNRTVRLSLVRRTGTITFSSGLITKFSFKRGEKFSFRVSEDKNEVRMMFDSSGAPLLSNNSSSYIRGADMVANTINEDDKLVHFDFSSFKEGEYIFKRKN